MNSSALLVPDGPIMNSLAPFLLFFAVMASSTNVDVEDMNRHRYIQKQAKLHGVHSELLRNAMQRMGLLVVDGIYTPLQMDKDEQEYLDFLVKTAADVVISAEILTQHVPIVKLDSEQRVIFSNLAEQLYNEASNVAGLAQDNKLLDMDAAFQRMEKICFKCHSLFREL